TPDRGSVLTDPPIIDTVAAFIALDNARGAPGEDPSEVAASIPPKGPQQFRRFTSPNIKGQGECRLIWLPLSRDQLRLCWEVVFTSASRTEMFRTLVDAITGQVWVRHCLTAYISDATYRVYTSDRPSPFSTGLSSQ